MPRKRNENKHWPDNWSRKHGAIYYRPPLFARHLWDNKTWFRLGATEGEAWITWYNRTSESIEGTPRTIGEAMDRYSREILIEKAEKTQREYRRALVRLRVGFGHMQIRALKPRHLYEYAQQRQKCVVDRVSGEQRSEPAPVAAKRELATLSAVMQACVHWGAIDRNPAREVRVKGGKPRDRYVTDAELASFRAHCRSKMLLAYLDLRMLTGARQAQILNLKRSDWDGTWLTISAAKGGRGCRFTDRPDETRLIEAVQRLRTVNSGRAVRSMYLLSTRAGTRYSTDGFRSIWQRAMTHYVAVTKNKRFREHDLRAKVATDSENVGIAQQRLGHKSSRMTQEVYMRRPVDVLVLSKKD